MKKPLNFIFIITAAILLMAMLSCSTTENVKQGYAINRQENSKVHLSKLAVDHFFHQVQPVQKDLGALYGLAVKLQKLHRHDPAIETFKEILRQDPENVKALNGVAVSFDLIGAHAAAAAYYQQALKVDPGLDHIWNNLGYCYFLQNRMDRSIDAYQKAIAINPDLQKYRNNLALVSAKQNQIPGSQKKMQPPKILAKIAPTERLKNRVSKPGVNQRLSTIDMKPIIIVTSKSKDLEKGIVAQQFDTIDLEPGKKGVLKPLPIAPSAIEIEPKDLEPEKASPPSDLLANPFLHKYKKNNSREPKKENRRHTEKIPFKALPSVKSVKSIAAIERPKINIQAREPVEMDTVRRISRTSKVAPNFQASVPQISSKDLVVIPPPVANRNGHLKHLRGNASLKKKRADKKIGLKRPTMVAKQTPEIQIFGHEVSNGSGIRYLARNVSTRLKNKNARLKKKRADKKIGLKRPTMVAKQTPEIQIFGLEVSNGNGIRYLARNVSTRLKNKGVQVSRITNAAHFQFRRSKLYYLKGLLDKARKLAEIIPGILIVEVPAFDHDQVRIKLLLGKDVSSAGLLL